MATRPGDFRETAPAPTRAAPASAAPAGPTAARKRQPVTCPKCDTEVEVPRLADRSDWPWLPTQDKGLLAPHPWCARCGRVKLVGAERALDAGGLVNLLGTLSRRLQEQGYKVTDAQRRLILKKLKDMEADDRFSLSRESQLALVSEVVSKYLYVPPRVVETYLRAC